MDTSIIAFAATNVGTDTSVFAGTDYSNVGLIMGWVATVLIAGFGVIVLCKMAKGTIDLKKLVSETDDSGASLPRFQFLIFTFVISMSLFWIILVNTGFPDNIPKDILILLGISGGSYLGSKGIQKKWKSGGSDKEPEESEETGETVPKPGKEWSLVND